MGALVRQTFTHDSMRPIKHGRWLEQRGCDKSLVVVVIHVHGIPRVCHRMGAAQVTIPRRARGCFTGTRTAGMLGRIPPADVIGRKDPLHQLCIAEPIRRRAFRAILP